MKTNWQILAVLLCLGVLASLAGAEGIYVTIDGVKQGQFKGDSTHEMHKGAFLVSGINFAITSPRDSATGAAVGKQHAGPLTFTTELSALSSQFFEAVQTNEAIRTVVIEFTRSEGKEQTYFSIKLSDAVISAVRTYTPAPATAPTNALPAGVLQDITVTFSKYETIAGPVNTQNPSSSQTPGNTAPNNTHIPQWHLPH